MYVCLADMRSDNYLQVVGVLSVLCVVLEFFTSSLFILLLSLFIGLLLVLLHATFRSPNLKVLACPRSHNLWVL